MHKTTSTVAWSKHIPTTAVPVPFPALHSILNSLPSCWSSQGRLQMGWLTSPARTSSTGTLLPGTSFWTDNSTARCVVHSCSWRGQWTAPAGHVTNWPLTPCPVTVPWTAPAGAATQPMLQYHTDASHYTLKCHIGGKNCKTEFQILFKSKKVWSLNFGIHSKTFVPFRGKQFAK